ncbi:hypothetical protein A4G31_00395 [Mycobacterium persicum]|nr:hypothetical protein A4G31_00395 [Mycobacterium persicum]
MSQHRAAIPVGAQRACPKPFTFTVSADLNPFAEAELAPVVQPQGNGRQVSGRRGDDRRLQVHIQDSGHLDVPMGLGCRCFDTGQRHGAGCAA